LSQLARIAIPLTLGAVSIGATLFVEAPGSSGGLAAGPSPLDEVALLVCGALLVLVGLLPLLTCLAQPGSTAGEPVVPATSTKHPVGPPRDPADPAARSPRSIGTGIATGAPHPRVTGKTSAGAHPAPRTPR
jgi:hypothetical protein